MKRIRQYLALALVLSACSLAVFALQYRLFHDGKTAGFYLLQDLGFLPLQVMLVSLVLNALISRRERGERLHKMNMAIGVFFQEAGTSLLSQLLAFDQAGGECLRDLKVGQGWGPAEFKAALKAVENHEPRVRFHERRARSLKKFLNQKREVLLGPLENANLLEHEAFTDLLWAVNHLADEFFFRESLSRLPGADQRHLEGDMRRALKPLLAQWLVYARHLSEDYPYMYSLVIRTNPFDSDAKVELK
jgi:hypothetical protein